MTWDHWKIVLRIGFITPFLNPMALIGLVFALAFGLAATGAASPLAFLFLLGVWLSAVAVLGIAPALTTGFVLVRNFRARLLKEGLIDPSEATWHGIGWGLGITAGYLLIGIAIINEGQMPITFGVFLLIAGICLLGGGISGLIAARMARSHLDRLEGTRDDIDAFD